MVRAEPATIETNVNIYPKASVETPFEPQPEPSAKINASTNDPPST